MGTVSALFAFSPYARPVRWPVTVRPCIQLGQTSRVLDYQGALHHRRRDFRRLLNTKLGVGLTGTTLIMGAFLLVALAFQFRARRYVVGLYWLAVVLLSVVGTLLTDNLSDHFHVPLGASTIAFSILLALTFLAWWRTEGTLSVHTITRGHRRKRNKLHVKVFVRA